jgi:hypothetical protein
MKRKVFGSISALLLLLVGVSFTPGSVWSATFSRITTIQVPGNALKSFDISWVDRASQRYYLADRSNKGVDIFNAEDSTFVGRIEGFVGPSTSNDTAGPNGVVVIHQLHQLWAGDGDSTVKVIDLKANPPKVIDTISTGGAARADEMAFDPRDHVLLVANDADSPPFLSFISTKPGHKVLGKIMLPEATNGVEQPVWDPVTHRFYISIPEINGVKADGEIAVINPRSMKITKTFPVNQCQPAGLTLGPHQHLLVGCSQDAVSDGFQAKSLILDARTGHTVATVTQVGGSDEVWFNPGDGNYYLAARGNPGGPVLGIIDAGTNTWIANLPTAPNAHSVAADPINNHVFVPLTPLPHDPVCVNGCIGVYAAQEERDDEAEGDE